MNDNQKIMSEAAKIMVTLTQKNKRLENEITELKKEIARWQNTFLAFAEYHFAEGGTAPNLPFNKITSTEVHDLPYEIIENDDHLTIIQKHST